MIHVSARAVQIGPLAASDVGTWPRSHIVPAWLRRCRIALIFALGLLCFVSRPARANPTVPQGGSNSFPVVNGMPPAISGWTVKLSGTTLGSTATPNGWSVACTGSQFTVSAPNSNTFAPIATGYQVAFGFMGAVTLNAVFDVVASGGGGVHLSTLTLTPASVPGGNASTGTATLSAAAPTGGAVVTLSSSNTAVATVPASVTVAAGQTSATFTVSTSTVASSTNVTISGSYGGSNANATLTVTPASGGGSLTVTLNPTAVYQGNTSTGTVTLSQAAPSGGALVSLSSSDTTKATVPASLTIPMGQTSGTFTVSTNSALTTPTSVTLTATYNAAHGSAVLTINISLPLPGILNLRCTSLSAPVAGSSLRCDWNWTPPTPNVATQYVWGRIYLPPLTSTWPAPQQTGTTPNLYLVDSFAYTNGLHYYYTVQPVPVDPNNLVQGYHYTPGPVNSILVVPEALPLIDDQTVDARWDPRYSTWTYLNHNFGNMNYRGGLYAGNAPDNSRMGRSFLRYGLPNVPLDSYNHWYLPAPLVDWTGNVGLYCIGAIRSSTGSGWSVGAQIVTDNGWTSSNLTWASAPSLDPTQATQPVNVTYSTTSPAQVWYPIPIVAATLSSALASVPVVVAGIAVTTEATDQQNGTYSWLYFARREFDSSKTPYLVFAWNSGPGVYVTQGTSITVQGGQPVTLTFACAGLSADLTLTLAYSSSLVSGPATITIPASTGQVSVTFQTQPVTSAQSAGIIYGYNSVFTINLTP